MRSSALVPLAVLAAGIATALAVESLLQAEPAARGEPQLELAGLRALAAGPSGAAHFEAERAVISSGAAHADAVAGTLAAAGETYAFTADGMSMGLAGNIVLAGRVTVSTQERTIAAATVTFGRDGQLAGNPAHIEDRASGSSFAAGRFAIAPDGGLELAGGVSGTLRE